MWMLLVFDIGRNILRQPMGIINVKYQNKVKCKVQLKNINKVRGKYSSDDVLLAEQTINV